MTIPIIQDIINRKDWDELAKSSFLSKFSTFNSNYEDLYFEKDLIMDFILNEKLFLEHLAHTKKIITSTFFEDSMVVHFYNHMSSLSIELDENEWGKWIDQFYNYYNMAFGLKEMYTNVLPRIFGYKGKNAHYFKMLANNDAIYEILKKIFHDTSSFFTLDQNTFDGLSDEEKEILKDRLDCECTRTLANKENVDELLNIFTIDELIAKKKNENFWSGLDLGVVIKDYSSEQFTEFIEDRIDKNLEIGDFFHYVKFNTDYRFSDKIADFILPYTGIGDIKFAKSAGIGNFTLEQIDKYHKDIKINTLSKVTDLPLSKITEYKGEVKHNLWYYDMFATDEEIAENPHFFDPAMVKRANNLYISPATFKLMNKAWGKRARYDHDLTNFKTIYIAMHSTCKNVKNLKYLKQKTNTSNTDFLNILSDTYIMEDKKLKTISAFAEKYK